MKTIQHAISRFEERIGYPISIEEYYEIQRLIFCKSKQAVCEYISRDEKVKIYSISEKHFSYYAIFHTKARMIISFENISKDPIKGRDFYRPVNKVKRITQTKNKIRLFNQSNICNLCNMPIVRQKHASIDHTIPISKGGTNERTNLKLTHTWCNLYKADKDLLEIEKVRFKIVNLTYYFVMNFGMKNSNTVNTRIDEAGFTIIKEMLNVILFLISNQVKNFFRQGSIEFFRYKSEVR